MPSLSQIADMLFKKWLGLGTTQSGRQFFNEPIRGRQFVVNDQIWGQSEQIPNIAPISTSGVIQKVTDYPLVLVPGTTNSFTGTLLRDAIPFNWGDGTSYNYSVKDSTSATIAFGVNDWTVDTEAGILMFNNGVPANMPPTISFYRYSGLKGINSGSFVSTGQTGQFYPNTNPSGYLPIGRIQNFDISLPSGISQTGILFPTGYSVAPRTVSVQFVNSIDAYSYSAHVGNISTSGFNVFFSDDLSSTGYRLTVLSAL